jgi:hypothetical protein
MAQELLLELTVESRGPGGAFVLSDEQVAGLGAGAKAFPVQVSIGGRTLALRLVRMGGENLIGLSKAARAEAGVEIGDSVQAVISVDGSARSVELPDDLAAALAADPAAAGAFEALAPSHRKEYVRWVTEAKREQTRADRVARTLEQVRAGQHR